MSEFDSNILSYLSRKTRDEQKMTQENASFGSVSKGTIHNIETQEKSVASNTILDYFENLGIAKNDLPQKISEAQKEIEDTQFELDLLQMIIDGGDLDHGKNKLSLLQLPKYHPLFSFHIYLKGRYWFKQGEWVKASSQFENAIYRYQKNQYLLENQILSHCYNLLGLCSYYQDDMENALNYAELGLNSRPQVDLKNSITSNIALYLSHSGNTSQAFYLINNLWPDIAQLSKISTRLNLYNTRTKLLRSAKQIKEAIDCAKEGLKIAFLNLEYNRAFELLNTLGNIYIENNELDQAEKCFSTVIYSEHRADPRRITESNLNMGILYAQKNAWNQAEFHLDKSLNACQDSKLVDKNLVIDVHMVYGNVLQLQGKYKLALNLFDKVLEMLHDSKQTEEVIARSLSCLLSLGNLEEFQKRSMELCKIQESQNRKGELYEIPTRWRR